MSARQLRVATYNLYLGADLQVLLGREAASASATVEEQREADAVLAEVLRQLKTTAFPPRAKALAAALAASGPDLVGLQEVTLWHLEGAVLWDYEALLLAALEAAGTPYEKVAEVATFTGQGCVGGAGELRLLGANVILRRQDSPVRVTGADAGMFGTALELESLLGAVSIARGWCSVSAELDGAPLVFVNTHTEAYEAGSRDAQRDELLVMLEQVADGPVVLVGDFNATPENVGMPEGYVDAYVAAPDEDPRAGVRPGGADGATCGQQPDLSNEVSTLADRIDYVWVDGVRVTGCRRIGIDLGDRSERGLWPSDHAGVVADLVLEK